jgi:hypothetical protein
MVHRVSLAVWLGLLCAVALPAPATGYPRIANLWGVGPQTTDYDRWAKYDLLVCSGGDPAAWRRFSTELRRRHPGIRLLATGPLMNLGDPTPWMQDAWFLRRPNGEKVRWWADQILTPNLFRDDCLDALVAQTEQTYGALLDDGTLDGVFYDSVVGAVSWLGPVDTDGDGKPDVPAAVDPRWQARQNLFFDRLRAKHPKMLILANDVDSGHAPHVNGRLYEGAPLLDRLNDASLSAGEAARTLNTWMTTTPQPGITFALMTHPLGWQGWRVGKGDKVTTPGEQERARTDFHRMRLGLLTALMTDACYAYDFGTVWYGLPWWYAEYDAPLGQPLGPAQEVFEVPPVPVLDWSAGQPCDAFLADAPGKLSPTGPEGDVAEAQSGWQRLFATDAAKLHLEPGHSYRLEADLQVIRKPGQSFQFDVRTAAGGWEHHDKGIAQSAGKAGNTWHIETTVVPDAYDDYALEWHCLGGGGLRLQRLKVMLVGQSYLRREFEGGVALLNPLTVPVPVKLANPLRRLQDDAAPRHVVEIDDADPGFVCQGAWEARSGESQYVGAGYRVAAKPGDAATWTFTAPEADHYTIFVTLPRDKGLTNAAEYAVVEPADGPTATMTQRGRDGGWVRLFEVKLSAGQRCRVRLRSAGTGATAADALRAESTARYNDGASVETVTLSPLDGWVLLKPR